MNREPILREKKIPHGKYTSLFTVNGGLHMIRGNHAPYFTLTYWEVGRDENGHKIESGGAGHEEILKHYPELADLAAMHLSDIDGAPMHATANGWYNLAGYFPDAFGERYHAGNSDRHCPLAPSKLDPAKPWNTTEYRKPTSDECLEIFARHIRVPLAEARQIAETVGAHAMAQRHSRNAEAKAKLAEIIETMRPRWKAEAEACIAKHSLIVFGDPWPNDQLDPGEKLPPRTNANGNIAGRPGYLGSHGHLNR